MRASPTRQKSQSPKPEKSSPVSVGRMAGGDKWRVSRAEGNVVHVQCDIKGEQWEQHFLLRSDAHHDNPKSDRSLELKHLQEAVGYDAGVIDCGDLFCAMQGKYDKRSSKSDIRPEHQAGDYLDRSYDALLMFMSRLRPVLFASATETTRHPFVTEWKQT